MTQRQQELATSDSADVPDDLVELGWIMGAHGIRGWIKIQPFSSDSQALSVAQGGAKRTTQRWWLANPTSALHTPKNEQSQPSAVEIEWARPHGATWLASLKGVCDRDQAHALKGKTVLLPRRAFPALEEDEFYWVDLIGCVVMSDETGESVRFGVVQSVQDNPAHPMLVVKQQIASADEGCQDRLDDKGKVVYSLIPFVKAHIGEVDLKAKVIHSNWPRDF